MAYPAINTLMTVLSAKYPLLKGKLFDSSYKNAHPKSDGMIPRLQAAGKDPNKVDPHTNGLALDIFLFVNRPYEKDLADFLVYKFIALKSQTGWSAVIYNTITTDDLGGPKHYTGPDPHTTHIHIQWPRSNSGMTSFVGLLSGELDEYAHSGVSES
jgi:hypothetical protein